MPNHYKIDPYLMNAVCNAIVKVKSEQQDLISLSFSAIESLAKAMIETVLEHETCSSCGSPLEPPALCTICSNLMNTPLDNLL